MTANPEKNLCPGTILVTGGAGFIGANFVLDWQMAADSVVVNLDKLTYAGNLRNLAAVAGDPRHVFVHGDIGDQTLVDRLLAQYRPCAIVNFAAESHVDRSVHGPADFIQTNVVGTLVLLEAARRYWNDLKNADQARFRFLHISTDEVYGSLESGDRAFREDHPYRPNSPYAASKAASDHLMRAWFHTYGLPIVTTNCSNNYGPHQFVEKLIPLMIHNALAGQPLTIHGDGQHIRDWLYVQDHCSAVRHVLRAGQPGETYNIGGWNEKTNLEVVHALCAILDDMHPRADGRSYQNQIAFVNDRRINDRRYAIDASRLQRELGWKPAESFESGLRKTVRWYLDHRDWIAGAAGVVPLNRTEKQYA